VTAPAPALPDDPGMLKMMLLEERAESERLRQIIKALQRHRFGRRAESLPGRCHVVERRHDELPTGPC
jgi:transposase